MACQLSQWKNSWVNVEFLGKTSKYQKIRMGVPQNGVLSPILLYYTIYTYIARILPPPLDVKIITYVNDCTSLVSRFTLSLLKRPPFEVQLMDTHKLFSFVKKNRKKLKKRNKFEMFYTHFWPET